MTDHDFNQPAWITETLSPADIAAISQGGCESGAYMPACTYHEAATTMAEHGDEVLDYLQDCTGELPTPPHNISWSQLACFYLSNAVELFCACQDHLADWNDDEPLTGSKQ
jgi:hypothetical protein